MCNLVRIPDRSNQGLLQLLGVVPEIFPENPPRMLNAFSRPLLPVLLGDGKWVEAAWTYMPPPGSKEPSEQWKLQTFNVKMEEMFEKRTFKDAARTRRGLLPVVGYYEYQHRGKVNVPYWFSRKDQELIWFPILWKFWEEENLYRFALGTMRPNRLNSWVHNANPRQPASVPWEKKDRWLSGTDAGSVAPFLVPDDNDGVVAEETEKPDGTRVVNPPPPPLWGERPTQAMLF